MSATEIERLERIQRSLTEGWSVMRLKEAGADAIKILIYYNQFENDWVNEQKKAWLERVGQECLADDPLAQVAHLKPLTTAVRQPGAAARRHHHRPEMTRTARRPHPANAMPGHSAYL